jgi:hypothetical protein
LIILTILAKSKYCEAPYCAVFSSLLLLPPSLSPSILLSTLFSKKLNPHPSLTVRERVSHSYKTTGKIILPYILIFIFLQRRWKGKRF